MNESTPLTAAPIKPTEYIPAEPVLEESTTSSIFPKHALLINISVFFLCFLIVIFSFSASAFFGSFMVLVIQVKFYHPYVGYITLKDRDDISKTIKTVIAVFDAVHLLLSFSVVFFMTNTTIFLIVGGVMLLLGHMTVFSVRFFYFSKKHSFYTFSGIMCIVCLIDLGIEINLVTETPFHYTDSRSYKSSIFVIAHTLYSIVYIWRLTKFSSAGTMELTGNEIIAIIQCFICCLFTWFITPWFIRGWYYFFENYDPKHLDTAQFLWDWGRGTTFFGQVAFITIAVLLIIWLLITFFRIIRNCVSSYGEYVENYDRLYNNGKKKVSNPV
ncbi:hypothetical protein PCE1_000601 [Barthelona sp. PCE]